MLTSDSAIPQLLYEAVSRGKREWEQTFDAVPDIIFITDTSHTIVRANRAMSKRFDMRPEELPGRKCHELFHGLPSPPPFCPYLKLMQEGGAQSQEIEEKALSAFFDISVSPLYNESGELVACVHVARDVTERKKAEEYRLALEQQLQHAQKLESLGVLTGGIAHDFNNILMIILGHCMLAKDDPNAESVQKHLNQIEVAGNRAADLCRQMLTYAGKSPLVQTRIDLRRLVDEIAKMLQPAFKKNVCFEYELGSDVPELTGDEGKLQQIVMNLVVNAVEAIGDDHGTVRVGLGKATVFQGEQPADFFGNPIAPGAYACLEVSDTGCGMDEQTQKRIFEPFFTTKFTGRGLGMSAIIGIIRSHKGALQLYSQSGAGTTFRVYFPVSAAAAGAEAAPRGSDTTTGPGGGAKLHGTVLLVDDEEELRRIGADILAAMGLTVITTSNGREALALYLERPSEIDLVLMDLTMPEMDGIETYKELRKSAISLPVIFCSGYGDKDISPSISRDAHAGFVPKPYKVEEVREVLKRLWPTGSNDAGEAANTGGAAGPPSSR